MKRKRLFSLILISTILMALVACSNKIDSPKLLTKEGIIPYELSASEQYILQSFGMEGNSQIISFNAPKESITLTVAELVGHTNINTTMKYTQPSEQDKINAVEKLNDYNH